MIRYIKNIKSEFVKNFKYTSLVNKMFYFCATASMSIIIIIGARFLILLGYNYYGVSIFYKILGFIISFFISFLISYFSLLFLISSYNDKKL